MESPTRIHRVYTLRFPGRQGYVGKCPEWVAIHRANLSPQDIGEHEGLPVTTVSRSIMDVLLATHRIDIARQSVSDVVREGLLNSAEASSLRRSISQASLVPSPIDKRKPGEGV